MIDREAIKARVDELVTDHVPAMFAGKALGVELMVLIDQVIAEVRLEEQAKDVVPAG